MSGIFEREKAFLKRARKLVAQVGRTAKSEADETIYAAGQAGIQQGEMTLAQLQSAPQPVLAALAASVEGTLPSDVYRRTIRFYMSELGRSGLDFVQQTGNFYPHEVELFLERLSLLCNVDGPGEAMAEPEEKKTWLQKLFWPGVGAAVGFYAGQYKQKKWPAKKKEKKVLAPPKEEEPEEEEVFVEEEIPEEE